MIHKKQARKCYDFSDTYLKSKGHNMKRGLFILLFFLYPLYTTQAQTAPNGSLGYDNFNAPLSSYTFWSGNLDYFHTENGYLLIDGEQSGGNYKLNHQIYGYGTQTRIRFRTRFTTEFNATFFIQFCGLPNGLSKYSFTDTFGGNSVFADCVSYVFVGTGQSQDVDGRILYAKGQTVTMSMWGDLGLTTMDYIDLSCELECGANNPPTLTPTSILNPTGIPRTPTATAYVRPQLTPPANNDKQDANCGVYECGTVDLSFPVLPALQSPTPLSISENQSQVTTVAMTTPSGSNYVQSTPVFNDNGEGSDLNNYIGGNGVLAPNDPNTGAPIETDFESILSPDNSLFIAYIKGIYDTDANYFGPFAPLVQMILSIGTLLMFIVSARLILPVAIILIGLMRKAWGAIMDLIPF